MPCAIWESKTSGSAMARASRELAVAALAGLAIVLVTATGCAGSAAGGYSPLSTGGDVGHALEQDFTRVVHESLAVHCGDHQPERYRIRSDLR